jgi:hypothetical protein
VVRAGERLLAAARAASADEFMRGQMEAFEARRATRRAARAFGDGHFDVPECAECVKAGATVVESFLIHSDPDPLPVPDEDDYQRPAEIDRLMALGYSAGTARLAAVPYRTGTGWPEISR